MANTSTKAFGYLFGRNNISRGIRPVVALIKAVARAFTFASLIFAVLFAFLFLASPSTLHSLARNTALHSDGIAVWMMGFLGLMALYLIVVGLTALSRMMDRFEERASEKAQTVMIVATLVIFFLMGSFAVYEEVTGEPVVKTPPAPTIIAPHQQDQALLHIEGIRGNLVHTKNIVGAAKIERLGPGHYEIWMRGDHP